MNRLGLIGGGIVAIVALIAILSALFTVEQREQALVLQFGEPKRVIQEPGLFAKWPLIQDVVFFDKRLLDYDAPAEEIIASDQKRLVVDAFARYRIVNPLLFYQTVRDESVLRPRLGNIINTNLRRVLGTVPLEALVSEDRGDLMRRIAASVRSEAAPFGINVEDVRIKRADLPQANSEAVFRRMQTERQQEAAELRALGDQQSRRIRAEADREKVVIVADAEKDGQILRGEGEGEMNQIFAKSFGRDPEFFAFYRSMQAYQEALSGDDTTMVLSPDSEFFRYFNDFESPDVQP